MWDATSGQTFGEYMRAGAGLGEAESVDVVLGETTWATRDQVTQGPRDGGRVSYQDRVDQLGHRTREHADGRRSVRIVLR